MLIFFYSLCHSFCYSVCYNSRFFHFLLLFFEHVYLFATLPSALFMRSFYIFISSFLYFSLIFKNIKILCLVFFYNRWVSFLLFPWEAIRFAYATFLSFVFFCVVLFSWLYRLYATISFTISIPLLLCDYIALCVCTLYSQFFLCQFILPRCRYSPLLLHQNNDDWRVYVVLSCIAIRHLFVIINRYITIDICFSLLASSLFSLFFLSPFICGWCRFRSVYEMHLRLLCYSLL